MKLGIFFQNNPRKPTSFRVVLLPYIQQEQRHLTFEPPGGIIWRPQNVYSTLIERFII